MMKKNINMLKKILKNKCNEINNAILERNRKIKAEHLLYCLINKITNNVSESIAISNMKIEKIIVMSRQGFDKKLQKLDVTYLKDILLNINELFQINKKSIMHDKVNKNICGKIYAVDGTKISIDKCIPNFNYVKSERYKKALVNTLYSITDKMPYMFDLDNSLNERSSFLNNLLKYVKKNDMIIFDRGYFSHKLIYSIACQGCFFICRIKNSSAHAVFLDENKLNDAYRPIPEYGIIRVIKYTIDDKSYYLATNLFTNDIDYFKNMYHERWHIEEFFKTLKCNLGASNIRYKSIQKIEQLICMQFILVSLTSYFEQIAKEYLKITLPKNISINHKTSLNIVGNKILIWLLFGKSNKKIIELCGIIINNKVTNEANRHYERICIRRPIDWYYGHGKKKKKKKKR